MAKLFDSLKRGVADAGSKAKVLIDANALKLRAAHVQREIDAEYQAIGALYYGTLTAEGTAPLDELAKPHVHLIGVKLQELDSIREKELELNGEKSCPHCRKAMPLESKFCSECGQAAPEPPVFEGEVLHE